MLELIILAFIDIEIYIYIYIYFADETIKREHTVVIVMGKHLDFLDYHFLFLVSVIYEDKFT